MQSKNFVFSLLILTFILTSGSLLLLELSTGYIFKHSKRMPDIRSVNKEYRINYINDYLSHKINPNKSYILILGDSQFYGYHQDASNVFSTHLAKHTKSTILNLAFNDARPNDVIKLLEIVQSHHVKINAIIYGLNMGHFGKGSFTEIRRLPEQTTPSILSLYTLKPNIIFLEKKLEKILLHTEFSQYFTGKKVDPSLSPPKQINHRYPKLLQKISELSKTTLIIFEPRSEIDLLRQPLNKNIKEKWVKLYKDETIKDSLQFINASNWMKNDCFIDNTHMNAKGHKVFYHKLLNELVLMWPTLFQTKKK